jgi:hypothetical protein
MVDVYLLKASGFVYYSRRNLWHSREARKVFSTETIDDIDHHFAGLAGRTTGRSCI